MLSLTRALQLALVAALALTCPAGALAQASAAPALEKPAAVAPSAHAAPRRGLLYEIKSDAGTVYLFGTLHVGRPEFYPLNVRTNQAFAASSVLYLEVNLSQAGLAQNATDAATYPEGISLDRVLSPAAMTKVEAALERYRIP